ncbi:uncharacterized protein L969DRAFT_93866 [Mixia osmundae IAM 14324]|uniref:Uncharacterized protein n=1 Tax=Mixia osmundae (strain CBS 9802 / IAM 14324 / JCM 22182 / KY 12970) TaxID=764103 RepID=G7E9T5_MIXOS|nr:uncharacterized protein L969DRAFT_93866 [Mixia osmundae IAM 14324]KEI40037.1 hypothetical protein L969DRAFT_93866 [Mixia osmundae IAM 14324]GAA99404.1 hypothetical protein E5Q_06102 [Mixia osmundae IAM 14324]
MRSHLCIGLAWLATLAHAQRRIATAVQADGQTVIVSYQTNRQGNTVATNVVQTVAAAAAAVADAAVATTPAVVNGGTVSQAAVPTAYIEYQTVDGVLVSQLMTFTATFAAASDPADVPSGTILAASQFSSSLASRASAVVKTATSSALKGSASDLTRSSPLVSLGIAASLALMGGLLFLA